MGQFTSSEQNDNLCPFQYKAHRQDAVTVLFTQEEKLLTPMQSTSNCLETIQPGDRNFLQVEQIQPKSNQCFSSDISHCH